MSNTIKLEKGVPIPESPKSFASKYPWGQMEVGDSFLIPQIDNEPIQSTRERASKAVSYAKRHKNINFCTRKVDGGIRVWRIE